ncbi:MAG: 6-hydroxymethylpterin diphosphokinase MptE-like protein [Ferroplasma sp.]
MNFDEWFPLYLQITDELRINRSMDYISSLKLSSYIKNDVNMLSNFTGKRFFVVGNAPSMKEYLPTISNGIVIVADSAIATYIAAIGYPDIIVSDLDGNIKSIKDAYGHGTITAIHAHGDNMDKIGKYAGYFTRGLATTQNIPFNHVYNFGGFSDGDRAAFLADYLNAQEIVLVGFDFNNVKKKEYYGMADIERKSLKLKWAKYLLEILAVKRGRHISDKIMFEI